MGRGGEGSVGRGGNRQPERAQELLEAASGGPPDEALVDGVAADELRQEVNGVALSGEKAADGGVGTVSA